MNHQGLPLVVAPPVPRRPPAPARVPAHSGQLKAVLVLFTFIIFLITIAIGFLLCLAYNGIELQFEDALPVMDKFLDLYDGAVNTSLACCDLMINVASLMVILLILWVFLHLGDFQSIDRMLGTYRSFGTLILALAAHGAFDVIAKMFW